MVDESAGEYRIERYRPELAGDVVAIHGAIYGPGLTVEEVRRKFDTSASGLGLVGHLAYAPNGDPAAFYGVFPVRVAHGARTMLAAQSGDTMTHPDHQGRGLFTKLGRVTYDVARDEGVAFVFGFPNANSYPGFVRRLGWTHERTMRSYWLPVPTFPLAMLAAHRPRLLRLLEAWQRRVLRLLRLAAPVEALGSSATDAGRPGVVRDAGYLAYKRAGLLTFTQSGVVVYLKLGPGPVLKVGDVRVVEPGASAVPALLRLMAIAVVCGVPRITYHSSPDSSSGRLLGRRMLERDGLPYGHVSLTGGADPEDFEFTYLDYDTF